MNQPAWQVLDEKALAALRAAFEPAALRAAGAALGAAAHPGARATLVAQQDLVAGRVEPAPLPRRERALVALGALAGQPPDTLAPRIYEALMAGASVPEVADALLIGCALVNPTGWGATSTVLVRTLAALRGVAQGPQAGAVAALAALKRELPR